MAQAEVLENALNTSRLTDFDKFKKSIDGLATGQRRRLTLDDWQYYDFVVDRLNSDIRANPEDAQARYNKGAWMLSAGKFTEEAWSSLTWRLFLPGCTGDYSLYPVPVWEGEDLAGKNILVWLEQGIGDQIQAGSLFDDAINTCASVTIYCNRRVWPLYKRSFPNATVLKPGQLNEFRHFDHQLTFSDLGQAFRKSFDDFGKSVAYLKPDPAKVEYFRAKYKTLKSGNKVIGLSWRSSNAKIGDGKTIGLRALGPVINTPGITWVSLQYSETPEEMGQHKVYRDSEVNQMWDMESFAAQVAALDGVISISNTALHVAGALGVKSLGLLSRGGCRNWYWFNERTDCPWYPSVELVRQTAPDDWSHPINRAKEWLNAR